MLKVAKSREERASRILAACRERMNKGSAQLAQLQDFRLEYSQRLTSEGGRGVNVSTLRGYGEFLLSLDGAIRKLEHQLAELHAEYESTIRAWRSARADAAALDNVVARDRRNVMRRAARREQADTDARALQRHQRNPVEETD